MVLFRMLNRGMFSSINGCISTGKEANVYHAVNSKGDNFAIKVYKTSILVFKDRDRCLFLSNTTLTHLRSRSYSVLLELCFVMTCSEKVYCVFAGT